MTAKLIAVLLVLAATPVAAAALIWPTHSLGAVDPAPSPTALAEIPPELLGVYRAAAATCPGLPWPVLAAIGWIESRHGRGTADPTTGDVRPPILGPPLDGTGGVATIRDPAASDGYARAQGPMQFLTTTWRAWATLAPDRPAAAEPDPHNAWDAIFTAARYLCRGRPRLTDLPAAVKTYNRSDTYVDSVLSKARDYQLDRAPRPVGTAAGAAPERAVAAAVTQLGVPYLWGGTSPGSGFDCSGLVQWAYAQAGVTLPRTTFQQVTVGIPVAPENVRVGDLVFSASLQGGRTIPLGHVAIYAGGGHVIVAPRQATSCPCAHCRFESRPSDEWSSPERRPTEAHRQSSPHVLDLRSVDDPGMPTADSACPMRTGELSCPWELRSSTGTSRMARRWTPATRYRGHSAVSANAGSPADGAV